MVHYKGIIDMITNIINLQLIISSWKHVSCSILLAHACISVYRVESGSDDPDILGHLGYFFGGSSGSHPQTKLSGCDPDITCSLENSVGI